ncbi:MAG TPA: type 1 glutamine amidotransferase [Anaerolineae bacterium]|nr:type 1 glutamine amidotransferase [Anaerolineae bacterium]
MTPKILLLQARKPEDSAKDEERQSFADRAGLGVEQFVPYDLLTGVPSLKEVRRYDALMVGGSGDYYVSKGNLPHFEATLHLLQEVTAVGHPVFASCFGFQLLVQALGGEIVFDPENMEVGTFDLTLTPAGQQDEVLGILPPVFAAQLGRKDRAARLPPGAINLTYSRRIPYQALRIPGKPVWGTQFHPELSLEDNRKRFVRYQAGYGSVMSKADLQKTLERFGPSPETEKLLARFLEVVFG